MTPKRNLTIESTLAKGSRVFGDMLESFYPAAGDNCFAERNLTFQFAHAFMSEQANAKAFMEIPCPGLSTTNKKWPWHIDGYVFNTDIGIFVESKQLYTSMVVPDKKYQAMALDKEKLSFSRLDRVIQAMEKGRKPRQIYRLLLAECWEQHIVEWWLTGTGKCKWGRDALVGMTVGHCRIKEYEWQDDSVLHWVYAYDLLHEYGHTASG